MQNWFYTLIAAFTLMLPSGAFAAQQDFGDYTVHYSVVNSTFITPEIAARYGIVRGDRNAFLNIAVLDKASGEGVAAAVTGSHENLLRQQRQIGFIEVREGESIYYIGQFEFSNAENLRFEVEILPSGATEPFTLSWTSQLYIN